MQTRLKPLDIQRLRDDYPQVDYIDKKGVQWIELNRGCPRQCPFCYADPNYKTFPVPEIKSNLVHIIGEGILYDSGIKTKFITLGQTKFNKRVVRYGLSQGVDYRQLTKRIAEIISKNRFGTINNKGNWYKGMRIAWDWGMEQEHKIASTIGLLEKAGYHRRNIFVYVLVNWKIPYELCVKKLEKLKQLGVKIDDCFWNTTKKAKLPLYWSYKELKDFRRQARKHNQLINHKGYDPEARQKHDASQKRL